MKICLVSHLAYGALTGEETGHIGGVERQTALFSEWLSDRGHDVSVIVWNEGVNESNTAEVKIIKLCSIEDGIPGLRFFHPRWTSLIRALREADADIYYHNCAEYVTGQIALWCRRNNRFFVYSVASDADCMKNSPELTKWRERFLFHLGLRRTDLVITQTHHQKAMLWENFQIPSTVIRMPGTPPDYLGESSEENRFKQKKILWVARIDPVKRIQWLIDIAEALPEYSFEVIGPLGESLPDARLISEKLNSTKNISLAGKIKRADMPRYYSQASLLCCTSVYEGFPNTYLEAWSYGIPVVTTVDPDDLIMSNQLGFASRSKDGLIAAIKDILGNESYWKKLSKNAKIHFTENHQLEKIQLQFEEQLERLKRHDDSEPVQD